MPNHNRRFLYLESLAGALSFPSIQRILASQLTRSEMTLEGFSNKEDAIKRVLSNPDYVWFIVTHYGADGNFPGVELIKAVRGHIPVINAYIAICSGSADLREKTAKALGADTFINKDESLIIPLQREFDIFINFWRKIRRNSVPEVLKPPPSEPTSE